MVFRFLGIEIRWVPRKERQRTPKHTDTDIEVPETGELLLALPAPEKPWHRGNDMASSMKPKLRSYEHNGRKVLTMGRTPPPWESIIWPEPDMSDPWSQTTLSKAIQEMEERYTRYNSFDICMIRDLIKEFRLTVTPATRVSLDKLHKLHCVSFDQLHPEVYRQIPGLVTHVFTEGRIVPDFIQGG